MSHSKCYQKISDPTAKNLLLWPRTECSELQGLGPVSTLKSHEVRMGERVISPRKTKMLLLWEGQVVLGNISKDIPYIYPIFPISVFILTLHSHPSYYSFVLVSYGLLTYTFLCTDSALSSTLDPPIQESFIQWQSSELRPFMWYDSKSAWIFPFFPKYFLLLSDTEMYFFGS